jgi:carbamoyltransferase
MRLWHCNVGHLGGDLAGKFMGLAGRGKTNPLVQEKIRKHFRDASYPLRKALKVGTSISPIDIPEEDLAYNTQQVLEQESIRLLAKHTDWLKEVDHKLVITGGVALNVIANSRLRDTFDCEVYVPPNPGDMGSALGQIAAYLCQDPDFSWNDPINRKSLRYATVPISDIDDVPSHLPNAKKVNLKEVADKLKDGKIIGTVIGNIESGPRALGHRSILCDPTYPDMKEIINYKVKFREWYRPFAPVCLKETVRKHFVTLDERHHENMSFICSVKFGVQERMPSITHVDGTARLQIVDQDPDDADLRQILSFMPDGCLLNTSFNIGGKPILNSLKDALWMLENTGLDHVLLKYEGEFYLF